MATYNKFQNFSQELALANQDFGTNVFKVYLSNAVPSASLDLVKADLAEIAAGNGYVAGGETTTVAVTETGGTTTVTGTQVAWTAAGGAIATFQYAILYNSSTAGGDLIAWWDYGTPVTLNTGETFTVKFNNVSPGTIFTLA